jgi:hypothetical protein
MRGVAINRVLLMLVRRLLLAVFFCGRLLANTRDTDKALLVPSEDVAFGAGDGREGKFGT